MGPLQHHAAYAVDDYLNRIAGGNSCLELGGIRGVDTLRRRVVFLTELRQFIRRTAYSDRFCTDPL